MNKDLMQVVMGRIQSFNGCWPIRGKATSKGYVQVYVQNHPDFNQRMIHAHRLMYILTHGPIDKILVVDHLCRNVRCVNPDHLEAVTSGENTRRGRLPKTHCPRGHAYAGSNLRSGTYNGRIHRYCRTCERAHAAEQRRKKREEVNT